MPRQDPSGRPEATGRLWISRCDSLAAPALIAFALVVLFVAVRLARFGGDASRFVVAGTEFVDPAEAPAGLHVLEGPGYDGQFFYRLALDPAELEVEAHGIRLDIGLRRARIAYPALAWALSGGQAGVVPWALIALNVAGVVVLAFLGAVAARDSGRHALWGLLVAAFPAFVFTVARDLSEVLAASALLAGLLLYRRQRPLAAAAALALAVLTRESALVAVAALFLAWLVGERRRRDAVAWALPAVAFALWEGVVYADVGSLPVRGDSGNLTAPLAGLLPELAGWLGDPASKAVVLRLAALALLVWVLVLAGASLRRSSARPQEKLAWALFLALAVCLSREIYVDPADFRVLGELWVLTMLVLLADARRRLAAPAVAIAALWGAEALYRGFVV